MNVSLTPELEGLINAKVASGMYNSASEVVRAGLRLIQQNDELHAKKLAALRSDIQKGLDSAESGLVYDADTVIAEIKGRRI